QPFYCSTRPRTAAIRKLLRRKLALCRPHVNLTPSALHSQHLAPFDQPSTCRNKRLRQRCAQVPRIDASLLQHPEPQTRTPQPGRQLSNLVFSRNPLANLRPNPLQCPPGPHRHPQPGQILNLPQPLRIQPPAQPRQLHHCRRVLRIIHRQHSARRPRGLAHRLPPLQHHILAPAQLQLEPQRQPNDPAARNRYVRSLLGSASHLLYLKVFPDATRTPLPARLSSKHENIRILPPPSLRIGRLRRLLNLRS